MKELVLKVIDSNGNVYNNLNYTDFDMEYCIAAGSSDIDVYVVDPESGDIIGKI